jgi:lipopolysaccharide export system permease protein
VFWGTIHRMILSELLKVFFMALVGLTGLILIAGIISEAMKNGLGPAQILVVIPLLLPSLLPYTVPTTTLFATCIVYGRLSADNEILALKAAGVHIIHIVWPAVFLGAVASAVTMFCYLDIIPYTGCMMRTQVIGDVEELLYTMLRKDGHIKHPNIKVEIHVKSISGRKLNDVIFKRRKADGNGFDLIAVAKEAELRVELAHKRINVHMQKCQVLHGNDGGVIEDKLWPVELPDDFFGSKVKIRATDMTWSELREYEANFLKDKEELELKRDLLQTEQNSGAQVNLQQLKSYDVQIQYRQHLINLIHADRQMRPAIALGCLCFALVGCPVGIWFSKSDYLSAFITCFLPIVILYYPTLFCMFDLARAGKIPPWAAAYNADAIMLLTGSVLFWRLSRN